MMASHGYDSASLSDWQREQLRDLPDEGVECLTTTWALHAAETHAPDELFCNSTYDGVGCWNFTRAGITLVRSCAEVVDAVPELRVEPGRLVTGNAFRTCLENGSWLMGNWTNYTECAENFDDGDQDGPIRRNITALEAEDPAKEAVRYILFIGSILSLVLLTAALFLFFYFKSLRCDRITVHIHLMTSLCFRFILLIVITEPFIFGREENYRSADVVCKVVISLLMYSTVASINWMFIQGHYLHGRLTTNIFDRGTPFKTYYAIGWGLPLLLILIWAFVMESSYEKHCWEGMADLPYIWIIVGPMIFAVLVNLLFLINIVRVLLTKIQRSSAITEVVQFRRAVKATLVLFPLLGINNLLFIYNPGGSYEKYYMLAYTLLQSSQGIFVSILYCFMSTDVRDAIRREYLKFSIRRSAGGAGGSGPGNASILRGASARFTSRHQRNKSFTATTATSVMMMTPRSTPGSGYKVEPGCACAYKETVGGGSLPAEDDGDFNGCCVVTTHATGGVGPTEDNLGRRPMRPQNNLQFKKYGNGTNGTLNLSINGNQNTDRKLSSGSSSPTLPLERNTDADVLPDTKV